MVTHVWCYKHNVNRNCPNIFLLLFFRFNLHHSKERQENKTYYVLHGLCGLCSTIWKSIINYYIYRHGLWCTNIRTLFVTLTLWASAPSLDSQFCENFKMDNYIDLWLFIFHRFGHFNLIFLNFILLFFIYIYICF